MEIFKDKLREEISLERYEHSLRVMETGMELGEVYPEVDPDKLKLACLLHDCAKYSDEDIYEGKIREYGFKSHKYYENSKGLIHGPLGFYIAKEEYGVYDEEILNAIKYHTTGRENMTDLDKLVFLADYIEPSRDFKGVKEIRELTYEGRLDEAVYRTLSSNIRYIVEIDKYLAIDTIKARNDLINSFHSR